MSRAALVAALLVAASRPAAAHQSSIAYSAIHVDGRDVEYRIKIASTDLYEAVGVSADRPVTRDEVQAGRARLEGYLLSHIHVADGAQGERTCDGAWAGLGFEDKADGFFAEAELRFRCPRTVEALTVRYDLFFDLDPRHQGLARITFAGEGDADHEQIFRDSARTLTLRRELGPWDHARDYLLLGVEHIFTGYDHIAFLFGLLAIAGASGLRRGAREVLGVVTAFTLAHSVTLIASALGLVSLPGRLVESAITLSIVYVGVENLFVPRPRHRFALTFGFGLVHGFGFASVLREIGLPSRGLLLSLVSFNVGVELGQLAVVAAVLPLLATIAAIADEAPSRRLVEGALVGAVAVAMFFLLRRFHVDEVPLAVIVFGGAPLLYVLGRRYGYDAVVRRGGSAVIAALAVFWFFERVLVRSWLGGRLG